MLEGGIWDEITGTSDVEGTVFRYLKRYARDGNNFSRFHDAGAGRLSNAGILDHRRAGDVRRFPAFAAVDADRSSMNAANASVMPSGAVAKTGDAPASLRTLALTIQGLRTKLWRHSPLKQAFRTPARTRSPRRVLRPWRRAASRGFPQTDRSGRAAFCSRRPCSNPADRTCPN